jgi:hypothetical protein
LQQAQVLGAAGCLVPSFLASMLDAFCEGEDPESTIERYSGIAERLGALAVMPPEGSA